VLLTQKHRPARFKDVVGSALSLKVLKGVCKNPRRSPRSIILFGGPGSGKTTCARILPRAINCISQSGDSCGKCEYCLDVSTRYYEFNCANVGNVGAMRELKDSLHHSFSEEGKYRVAVFDEIQSASTESQSILLEMVEECPSDLFFVFCTTNIDQVLDTLKSRSIEIEFGGIHSEETISVLKRVSLKEDIFFSDTLYERIAKRSRGDIRLSLNLLQKAVLVGEEDFMKAHAYLYDDILGMFNLIFSNDFSTDRYREIVDRVLNNPVEYIRNDFEQVVIKLSDGMIEDSQSSKILVFVSDFLKIQQHLHSREDWNIYFNLLRRHAVGKSQHTQKTGKFERTD